MKNNIKFNFSSFKYLAFLALVGFFTFLFASVLVFSGLNKNVKIADASIAVGDTSTLGGQITSGTFSHTVGSGDNKLLIVSVTLADSGSSKEVQSVTFDGQSLQQSHNFEGTDFRVQVFRMINPSEATADVQVTIEGGKNNKVAVGAVTMFGANQTAPLESFIANSGNQESISLNVSSESGDLAMDHLATDKTLNASGSGQTQRWVTEAEPDKESGVSTEPGDLSTTMSWGTAPGKFSHVGWNINLSPDSLAECEDGIDNDGDGQIDYPEDNGCDYPADNNETDPSRGGISDSAKVKYSGIAYPNGTVTFQMEDENGNTCQIIFGLLQ